MVRVTIRLLKVNIMTRDFQYYTPTKVIFGKNADEQCGAELKAQGASKVLVHFGGASAQKSGLLDKIYASLDKAGLAHISLGGVIPNPLLSLVKEGIALCRKEKVDYILAVGGGSVIDSSKAIALGVPFEGDVWDIFLRKAAPSVAMPVSAVLTIAAAGSEMSDSVVITNEEGLLKRGFNSNLVRCKTAFMNPELTYTLPAYQTASGCVDILMHTLERYFLRDTMDITDRIAEGLMQSVIAQSKIVMKEPNNYDARANIMWASSLSHNGLTECGSLRDFAVHALEHELSGMFGVAHGAGLAALWASWARYIYKDCPERFAHFATAVMGVDKGDTDATALAGIAALEKHFHELNMPTSISALGVELTAEQIKELAYKCSFSGTRKPGALHPLEIADMEKIYSMAK